MTRVVARVIVVFPSNKRASARQQPARQPKDLFFKPQGPAHFRGVGSRGEIRNKSISPERLAASG